MLTQLQTVRSRLGLTELELQWDAMLTMAIKAVSARFDRHCNRTFARTVDAKFEFEVRGTEVIVPCYPIESVSNLYTKESDADYWVDQLDFDYVVRGGCVISLTEGLEGTGAYLARVTYTGGYVLPGTVAAEGQTPLPSDIEHAATEQVAFWFQSRDKLGLIRHWPSGGTYIVFNQAPLLTQVTDILKPYKRWSL